MLTRAGQIRSLAIAVIAILLCGGTASAVENAGRGVSSKPAQVSKSVKPPAAEDDDEDEDAFFSSGSRTAVATAAPMQSNAAPTRLPPSVDVDSVCRAVLADNLNLYNYSFIEGCRRTVAANSGRRLTR